MEQVLVIGCGNPLRSDDGMAWLAAEQLRRKLPDTRIVCVQQLTPELAEDVASADLVIFLDASSEGEPGDVRCAPVVSSANEAQPESLRFSHHLSPSQIMVLADRLYSAKPRAFLISIHAECFDHGQSVSLSVTRAIPEIAEHVLSLTRHASHGLESKQSSIAGIQPMNHQPQ